MTVSLEEHQWAEEDNTALECIRTVAASMGVKF